jgi:hypothetical protein
LLPPRRVFLSHAESTSSLLLPLTYILFHQLPFPPFFFFFLLPTSSFINYLLPHPTLSILPSSIHKTFIYRATSSSTSSILETYSYTHNIDNMPIKMRLPVIDTSCGTAPTTHTFTTQPNNTKTNINNMSLHKLASAPPPPRTLEQKLFSAQNNPNLVRIATGESLPATLMHPLNAEGYLRRAAQLISLAKALRDRISKGGIAYLHEAEDAEAWADKLKETARQAASYAELVEVQLKSQQATATAGAGASEDAEVVVVVPSNPTSSKTASPKVEITHKGEHSTNGGLDTPEVQAPTPASITKRMSLAPHRKYAVQKVKVTHKGEQSTHDQISTPEAQVPATASITKMMSLAPHRKYASQKVKAEHKDEQTGDKPSAPEVQVSAPAQVTNLMSLAPHRKYASQNVKVEHKTEQTDASISTPETQVPAAVVIQKLSLAPHRKYASRKSEMPKLPEVHTKEADHGLQSIQSIAEELKDMKAQHLDWEDSSKIAMPEPTTEMKISKTDKAACELPAWQPSYIRNLPCLSSEAQKSIPGSQSMHRFSHTFLLTHLGGEAWIPSFNHVPSSERSLLPNRGYYLLDPTLEPLCPTTPGHHGSLLTPILRLPCTDDITSPDPSAMQNAPLFVKAPGENNTYIYYGMYSFKQALRLDIDRCLELIPASLLQHWADLLSSSCARPAWMSEILQRHLLLPPCYSGPCTQTSRASEHSQAQAMSAHVFALQQWQRDSHIKLSFCNASSLLAAFQAPDTTETAEQVAGIRFWNLGLQCDGWDEGFYAMMVRDEAEWKKQGCRDAKREKEQVEEMIRILKPKWTNVCW